MHFKEESSSNKKYIIRRIILLLLLAAFMIFLYTQKEYMRDEKKVPFLPSADYTIEEVSVLGTHELRQSFVAKHNHLGLIRVFFHNPDSFNTTGNVKLTLVDDEGNKVADTTMRASYIVPSGATKFFLGGSSEAPNSNGIVETHVRGYAERTTDVEKGKRYTIILNFDNIKSGMDVTVESKIDPQGAQEGTIFTIDGEEQADGFLRGSLTYRLYSKTTVRLIGFLLLIALAFILMPIEYLDRKLENQGIISRTITRIMFIISPFVSYFITETYMGKTFSESAELLLSWKGFLNMIVVGFVWWIFYALSNRVKFTALATVLTGSAFGLINYSLIVFRASPLMATDIPQIRTAMEVAGTYVLTWNRASLWSLLLTTVWCLSVLAVDGHKGLSGKKRLMPLAGLLIWCAVFYYSVFVYDAGFRVSGFKARTSYTAHGSALSFAHTIKNSFIKKPAGYSPQAASAIAEGYASDPAIKAGKPTESSPNIIIVMNESFTDFASLGKMKTNEDYMPFYHSLKDNTVKGWMNSSVFGGATADSEFECLTGLSMRFLPLNSIPYNAHIKGEVPSLTYSLKALGYEGNIAFHPGMRNSYNRGNVYPLLGFDKHIAVEDLPEDAEKIRAYTSDSYDYKVVEQEYEALRKGGSEAPYYMFNVTIQNHGGYQPSKGVIDAGISILEEDKRQEDAIQFVNLMKLSDKALEELIDYFSEVDEPTVIVLFGDHQPKVDGQFYSSFSNQLSGLSPIEAESRKFRTPFLIWANYDIEEESGIEISANYIGPYLLRKLGMPLTGFDKYLLDIREKMPVVTEICFKDAEGTVYDPVEESPLDDVLSDYSIIQYNGLVDSGNRMNDFFYLKEQ